MWYKAEVCLGGPEWYRIPPQGVVFMQRVFFFLFILEPKSSDIILALSCAQLQLLNAESLWRVILWSGNLPYIFTAMKSNGQNVLQVLFCICQIGPSPKTNKSCVLLQFTRSLLLQCETNPLQGLVEKLKVAGVASKRWGKKVAQLRGSSYLMAPSLYM